MAYHRVATPAVPAANERWELILEAPNKGVVCLTLDDCTSDHYSVAYPILTTRAVPGTFYVITDRLDTGGYLTSAQVTEISAGGHEIGSHGTTHVDFTTLTAGQLTTQLADSQTAIEALTGEDCTSLAYPFGAVNASVNIAAYDYYDFVRGYQASPRTMCSRNTFMIDGISGIPSTTTADNLKSLMDSAARHNHVIAPVLHIIGAGGLAAADLDDLIVYGNSLGLSFLTVSQAFQKMNLVVDEDFGRGIGGWLKDNPSANHSMFTFPAEGPSGEICMKYVDTATCSRIIRQEFPVTPGVEYFGRCQFQSESWVSGSVTVYYEFLNINRTTISTKNIASIGADYAWQWTPAANRTATAPANAHVGRIGVYANSLSGTVRLRRIQVFPNGQDVFN